MTEVKRHVVTADEAGMRLDRWFKVHFPQVTFAYLNKLTRTGQVRVAGARAKTSTRLEAEQEIRVPPLAFDTRPADAPKADVKPLTRAGAPPLRQHGDPRGRRPLRARTSRAALPCRAAPRPITISTAC